MKASIFAAGRAANRKTVISAVLISIGFTRCERPSLKQSGDWPLP